MATKKAGKPAKRKPAANGAPADVASVLAALHAKASPKVRDGMARFAIPSDHALGVAVSDIRKLGKTIGFDHELARELWKTGVYEARMLVSFVADPARLTPAEMDRWCRDFDNWAICDTLCFHLFDRSEHAFARVAAWAKRDEEFVKRAAFALLASLALHDKQASDDEFLACLPALERAATDDRNFVKKGVSWALRSIGERNADLHAAAAAIAIRLAAATSAPSRFIGKEALREFARPAVRARLAKRAAKR
jgi:3-methyladenine DNA glycosylase AlkD